MSGDTIWYFAYGANMSRRVLDRRGLRPLSSEPGRLDGYRLRFSHRGVLPIEPAFANIEAHPGATVHGGLYRLRTDELQRLDLVESADYAHVDVEVLGATSGAVVARAYLDPRPVEGRVPSRRYLRVCCDGARELGLPEPYVSALAAHPSLHVPVVSDVATLLVGTAERLRRALGGRTARRRVAP